jgi:hypothetical protein
MTRTKLILLAVFRVMALVGMLFSAHKPDIAVPGLIAALVIYLGTYAADYISFLAIPKSPHAHDTALYRQFLGALAPDKFLNGLGSTTLGATFRTDLTTDTFRFVDHWRTADKEFIDKKIQSAFVELYKDARAFANEVATLTVPWGKSGEMTTTKDMYKMGE